MKDRSNRVRRQSLVATVPLLVICVGMLGGCARFGKFAKGNADRTAYSIIRQKQDRALGEGESTSFTLEKTHDDATEYLLGEAGRVNLKVDTGYTTPTLLLSLADTLAVTVANSRRYQTQKETLFSQALGLARLRYDYGTIPTASGSGDYTRTQTESKVVTLAGPQTVTTVEKFGAYDYTVGLSKKVALTGAVMTANFAHSFSKLLNSKISPTDPSVNNNAAFSIVQPLLNGAGPLVAGEPLRQGERELIYAVRDFQRFQQSFAIDSASGYYRLLQTLDTLMNQYHNYQSAITNRERTEMMSAAGRVGEFEADQARQRELTAQGQLNNAQALYLAALDQFKLAIGLPLDLDFGPDPREIEMIAERGLMMPSTTLEQAIDSALASRLDYLTAQDRRTDAERHVRIAFRDFLPTLDAGYSYRTSQARTNDKVDLDFRNNTQNFSLNMILPLDWTPRRNAYRLSLINLEQAKRAEEQLRDEIIVDVRDLWRQLDRARKNYEIQAQSVRLAERRVESVGLLLDAGRATTRDLLDAQDDLLTAKNSLTAALVSHTIQRLQFWDAIERFKVDSKGMWYEQK